MLHSVLSLVRADIERQARWAVGEARRGARSAALTAGLLIAALAALIGLAVVGCMALYTWAAAEHGPLIGLAAVAGVLAAAALLLLAAALLRGETAADPRPEFRSADPAVLKQAIAQDMSAAGEQAFALAKSSRIGPAILAGEEAMKAGSSIYRTARGQLTGRSTGAVVGSIAVAAVLGIVLGRRI